KALEEANANVKGMVAIFSYGFGIADENFKNADIQLHTLSNYENLLEQALETNYITEEEEETLQSWRTNPAEWNI
ncbi:MAG: orotate phosphoribosyltransferase, partial [Aquimarina sp.]|nr:orotate phosphoribosyltransferase [Aquimarina sp.]